MQGIAGRTQLSKQYAKSYNCARAVCIHTCPFALLAEVSKSLIRRFFTTVPPFVLLSQSYGVPFPSPACVEAFPLSLSLSLSLSHSLSSPLIRRLAEHAVL